MKRVDLAQLDEELPECKSTKTKDGDVVRTAGELVAKIEDISAVLAFLVVQWKKNLLLLFRRSRSP